MVYEDDSTIRARERELDVPKAPPPRRREEIGLLEGIRVSLIMLYRGIRETVKDRY